MFLNKLTLASLTAVLLSTAVVKSPVAPSPLAQPSAPAALPHCQVPCGIYGDSMRISMLMEDAATIEKGMKALVEMDGQENPSQNQMVRWVMTKDEHASAIQEQVASYWLAQRIKAPKAGDEAGRAVYLRQLELMHGLTVAAMKCKQTTDVDNVTSLRTLAMAFSETYFKKEDLEHLRGQHEGH